MKPWCSIACKHSKLRLQYGASHLPGIYIQDVNAVGLLGYTSVCSGTWFSHIISPTGTCYTCNCGLPSTLLLIICIIFITLSKKYFFTGQFCNAPPTSLNASHMFCIVCVKLFLYVDVQCIFSGIFCAISVIVVVAPDLLNIYYKY